MKKHSVLLFSIRMFLYFSVITLIFIHPGVTVSFDRIGYFFWLFLIPLIAVVTFFYIPLFKLWTKIAALEPFFLAWVCLRLLSLSRSGEDIAGQSMALTQFILVWTVVVFLLHSIVVYLCVYKNSRAKSWQEGIVFFGGAAAALIVLIAVLPHDFVRNTIIENLVPERLPQRIGDNAERGLPRNGNGRRTLPRGERGRGELRGLSEHDWPGRGDGSSGESRQYMIKIVVAEGEPVYMGNSFRGQLDSVNGFLPSPQEPLNEIARTRFFVTWHDSEHNADLGRQISQVISLSSKQQKYLPYRPVSIDPTILSEGTGPLRYIHQIEANRNLTDPLALVHEPTRQFTNQELATLDHYLEVPLQDEDREVFNSFLNNALANWNRNRSRIIYSNKYLEEIFGEVYIQGSYNEHVEKLIALLVNFSDYQYSLVQDDDYSIAALKDFILNTKEGDCVEFSNSLALLGRLAGIPSRVVTGYLAAEGLQTPAHLRGLAVLRQRIPFLQQFPFEHLFMVTNLHAHSWTQFYIPGYGWLDFESTSFSIPPEGSGDFNNWDVVIPILDGERTFSQVRKFPWQAVGRAALILIIIAIACAYALRYIRELVLYIAQNNDKLEIRARARSLYLLLLARLAADGKPIKPASKTATEYSELFSVESGTQSTQSNAKYTKGERGDCFIRFAEIYSELRWRVFSDEELKNKKYEELKQEYKNILNMTKRKGVLGSIIRIVSLRGLAYL